MSYPEMPNLAALSSRIQLYAQLKHEHGSKGITPILARAEKDLRKALDMMAALPVSAPLAALEPSDLPSIRALRPDGPRRVWTSINADAYASRIEGALLGRCAGCTLGAPVEGWSVANMELLAKENDEPFPPKDYWQSVPNALHLRYKVAPMRDYTRGAICGVPVDDDLVYTLLGLLIVENYGPDFTVADVGKAWTKYLPYACTAEEVALKNLKAGVPALKAAERDNPYCEWLGADIRADPWGYLAPGWPEKAAELAWRDAYLSHRRQGIYGAMYFAAAISAAFTVNDPMEALRIGLTEIPAESTMAKTVRWALETSEDIATHQQARATVDARFHGMHHVHTLNNACLTIFGIAIGGTDFSRVIGETVAMGMDNDCTAATAGSIVGAVVGKAGIPKHWYARFNNTIHSYLNGRKKFSISGLARRFAQQASRVFGA
jgi:ADP-ribosylglycohydrolase